MKSAMAPISVRGEALSRVDGWTCRAEEILAAVACGLVLLMVLVICADVTLRATMRSGLTSASAVAEYSLYAITFLAAPLLLRKGQHIRVDLALRAMPPKAAWLLEWAVDACGAAISGLFLTSSVHVLVQSYSQSAMVMREVMFPEWWLYIPMPISLALLTIEFLLRMRRLVQGERQMREEATSAA